MSKSEKSKSEKNQSETSPRKKLPIIIIASLAVVIVAACSIFFLNQRFNFFSFNQPMQIKVGHSMFEYPPLHYHQDGELVGFDIELAGEVAKIINAEFDFIQIDWSRAAELLESGEVDMLWGGLERASLDERVIRFTRSYLRSDIVLLMRSDRDYNAFEDLQGLNVCALNFTPAFNYLQVLNRDIIRSQRSFTPPEYQSLLSALSSDEFDAMITDTSFASFFLRANSGESFRMSDTLIASNYAVAVRIDDTELFDLLQGALDELEANGTIGQLREKWIG